MTKISLRFLLILLSLTYCLGGWAIPRVPLKHPAKKTPFLTNAYIIGNTDDRIQLPNPLDHLAQRVGKISATFSDGFTASCSGTIVEDEYVVAAAHCVYLVDRKEVATQVIFEPAVIQANSPTYPAEYATELWITKKSMDIVNSSTGMTSTFVPDEYIAVDIALIRFSPLPGRAALGNLYGWHNMGLAPSYPIEFEAYTLGYPSDKERSTLWKSPCVGKRFRSLPIISTDCDSAQGQSGSSIFTDINGLPTAVGVISSMTPSKTTGAAFTPEVLEDFKSIFNGRDPNLFEIFNVNRRPLHRLFIENSCKESLNFFLDYKTSEGRFAHQITTEPLTKVFAIDTDLESVDFYIENSDASLKWEGPKQTYLPKFNREFKMHTFPFGKVKNDHILHISCQ